MDVANLQDEIGLSMLSHRQGDPGPCVRAESVFGRRDAVSPDLERWSAEAATLIRHKVAFRTSLEISDFHRHARNRRTRDVKDVSRERSV
jgi:hypothetical protein